MIDAILARPEDFTRNENENMTRDGRRVFVRWANMVIFDEQLWPVGISCIGQDITENRKAEETIRNLAFYDGLTALPNRRLLIDRLHQAIALSSRLQEHGALLFIDLDNFKLINDSRGHDMGDRLLVEAAHRLQVCVREADSVARLGGDEFVVMLEELDITPEQAAKQARAVAAKILEALAQPYRLGEQDHHCSASIGIALFFEKKLAVDELLKRADLAMYQAKAAGRNTLRFFDPAMQAAAEARSRLETELYQAIRRQEFLFHYQPQVNAAGRVIGYEALARWQHPRLGLVMPGDFIGPAEETGLIIPIGQQLMHQACAHLAALAKRPDKADLSISINISARQFHHPDFIDSVLAALRATGANPARLILELTESMLLDNLDECVNKMHLLKATGIRFAIDDFGTGYSSLAYLKRLPLDELKIDRSFVADIETDENDAAICAAFISLAHILELRVVAEGVETEAQRIFLTEVHGCDAMQGWLFGRPEPSERFDPAPDAGSVAAA
jgi:diguanylate cyclase (GGDEF)-like protein